MVLRLKTNKCVNLPTEWENRASSLLINTCVVVFTTQDCKYTKEKQIFTSLNDQYFDENLSLPSDVPSNSFYGSLYAIFISIHKKIQTNLMIFFKFIHRINDRIKSYRACTDLEKLLTSVSINRKKYKHI